MAWRNKLLFWVAFFTGFDACFCLQVMVDFWPLERFFLYSAANLRFLLSLNVL